MRTCVCACFISAEVVLQDETGTATHEEFVTSDVRVQGSENTFEPGGELAVDVLLYSGPVQAVVVQ